VDVNFCKDFFNRPQIFGGSQIYNFLIKKYINNIFFLKKVLGLLFNKQIPAFYECISLDIQGLMLTINQTQ